MLSLDSTLRFIRKCVSFYLLLSPVFSLIGCFGFLSDIVIASFPHIHMSNLFPLLCLRYSTVFWQCQPCLLIILCFFSVNMINLLILTQVVRHFVFVFFL